MTFTNKGLCAIIILYLYNYYIISHTKGRPAVAASESTLKNPYASNSNSNSAADRRTDGNGSRHMDGR